MNISEVGSSKECVHARSGNCGGESCTSGKIILSWLGAVKATLLAPSKEACCLAILESIGGSGIVALAAGSGDAEVRLDTRSELVMVDAGEGQSLLATCVLLLTNILRISKGSLVVRGAATCGLKARLGHSSGKPSTSGKIILSWLGAIKAALLAPSKEACSLAILESIGGSGIVALAAGSGDAKVRLDTRSELVMVDAGEGQSLLAACVLLLTNILRISKGSLVIRRATTSGLEAWCW